MLVTVNGVPSGQYTAEFVGIEQKAAEGDFGPALIWKFLIIGGQYDGQLAARFTGATPTAKNAAGKLLRAVTGKTIEPGVTVDLDAYVGRRYHVLVADAPSGNGTRVETCVAITDTTA